jgi:predicted transcriptional regulator YheO
LTQKIGRGISSAKGGSMSKSSLMENLKRIADGLALFLGRNCEIVVHDLQHLESSVAHIAGSVTGRRVGSPATNLLVKHLAQHGDDARDLHAYSTQSPTGHPLKSTTMFMRDARGRVVAAICINYDITSHLNALALIEEHVRINSEADSGLHETFVASVGESEEDLVRSVLKRFGKHPIDLNREERIEAIKMFEDNGVFRIRGMVEQVSVLMGISKYTLYGYRRNDK